MIFLDQPLTRASAMEGLCTAALLNSLHPSAVQRHITSDVSQTVRMFSLPLGLASSLLILVYPGPSKTPLNVILS